MLPDHLRDDGNEPNSGGGSKEFVRPLIVLANEPKSGDRSRDRRCSSARLAPTAVEQDRIEFLAPSIDLSFGHAEGSSTSKQRLDLEATRR
jgi:hypothetical protein